MAEYFTIYNHPTRSPGGNGGHGTKKTKSGVGKTFHLIGQCKQQVRLGSLKNPPSLDLTFQLLFFLFAIRNSIIMSSLLQKVAFWYSNYLDLFSLST